MGINVLKISEATNKWNRKKYPKFMDYISKEERQWEKDRKTDLEIAISDQNSTRYQAATISSRKQAQSEESQTSLELSTENSLHSKLRKISSLQNAVQGELFSKDM